MTQEIARLFEAGIREHPAGRAGVPGRDGG